jgi:hypothetical protein
MAGVVDVCSMQLKARGMQQARVVAPHGRAKRIRSGAHACARVHDAAPAATAPWVQQGLGDGDPYM